VNLQLGIHFGNVFLWKNGDYFFQIGEILVIDFLLVKFLYLQILS
jgi:hypothetical protein